MMERFRDDIERWEKLQYGKEIRGYVEKATPQEEPPTLVLRSPEEVALLSQIKDADHQRQMDVINVANALQVRLRQIELEATSDRQGFEARNWAMFFVACVLCCAFICAAVIFNG